MTILTQQEWLENIIRAVRHFASEDYQRNAWLGGGSAVSSPTEMYNELYDDFMFQPYFDQYGSLFTSEQRLVWLRFDEMLEAYGDDTEESLEPQTVLNDPRWALVRDAASQFLQAFAGQ